MRGHTFRWGAIAGVCAVLMSVGVAHADDAVGDAADVSVRVEIDEVDCRAPVLHVPAHVAELVLERSKGKARPFAGTLLEVAVSGQCGSEKPDKPGKPDKPDKPGKPGKPDRPDKPDKRDKPNKPAAVTVDYSQRAGAALVTVSLFS